jgi:hypothetical protein
MRIGMPMVQCLECTVGLLHKKTLDLIFIQPISGDFTNLCRNLKYHLVFLDHLTFNMIINFPQQGSNY